MIGSVAAMVPAACGAAVSSGSIVHWTDTADFGLLQYHRQIYPQQDILQSHQIVFTEDRDKYQRLSKTS